MYIKWLILLIGNLLLAINSYSQQQTYNWYFGLNAGLNFATGNPVALTNGSSNQIEGCSSTSDNNGNLLFYTDGMTVYNKQHQVMVNGSGLYGGGTSTQAAAIVPQPGNDSLYYIFTTDHVGFPKGFCYSIVNIKMDNGLGAVLQKNISIYTPTTEKIAIINHCNGKDIWVITHGYPNNLYYAHLLTANGLTLTPVISATGSLINNAGSVIGQMKVSPNGKQIAAAWFFDFDSIELSDFNNATGSISNTKKIVVDVIVGSASQKMGVYGVEFSPSSKYLYVSWGFKAGIPQTPVNRIFQLDASLPNATAILASKVMLENNTNGTNKYYGLQLASDGKIYIAKQEKDSLAVIQNPNNQGFAANFQKNGVSLANRLGYWGLPTFNQSLFYNPIITTGNCLFTNISFSLNNIPDIDSVKWNFGDVASGSNNFSNLFSPTHIFTAEGIYTVQAILYNKQGCSADTVYKKVYAGPFKVFLGNDTGFCQKDTMLLKTNIPNATNLWNNGSTDTILKVSTAGKYWVKVSLVGCTATDTIDIIQNPLPVFSLGADTAICSNAAINLMPTSTLNNMQYSWSNGSTNNTIQVANAGMYWLQVTSNKGCKFTDSITVNSSQLPNYNLGNDTAICFKDTLVLNAFVANATSYLWNTGATTATIKVTNAGIYWCNVNSNGCVYRDSIRVTVNPLPTFSFGSDTTYCGFSSVVLRPNANNISQYIWQDGSTKDSLVIVQSGTFWARLKDNLGCVFTDTVQINLNQYPQFNLGKDTTLCDGQSLTLNAFVPNANSYTWQNGSLNQQLPITNTGLYWCSVTLAGCTKRDSITVTYFSLPIVHLGNDTLLCNNDTLVLDAANIGATYVWSTGQTTASIVAKQPQLYTVNVTKNNCTSTDAILIQYSKTPIFSFGADKTICTGDSILLKPILNITDGNFLWSSGNTSNNIVVKTEGVFSLTVSNFCGIFTDTVMYTKGVCKFIVPNAFSPNGDRINDIFLPLYGENVEKYRLTIYNRNGQIVFTSNDRSKAWDGSKNGMPLPVATYYWVLDYTTSTNKTFTHLSGSITLLR